MAWNGDDYQGRFDVLASGGGDVHGEAELVWSLVPRIGADYAVSVHRRRTAEQGR